MCLTSLRYTWASFFFLTMSKNSLSSIPKNWKKVSLPKMTSSLTKKWKWKWLSRVRLFVTPWTVVHGILQARILEWVAFPSPGDLPNPGIEPGLPHCRWILDQLSHQGSPRILEWVAYPFSRGIFPTQESNLGLPVLQADSLPAELSTSMESDTIAHKCYLDFGKQYSFIQI